MAVSFIGSATAEATSVTLPTHQAGDLILIFALRLASGVNVTPVSGWVTAGNVAFAGNTANLSSWFKIAENSSETSGTITNADLLLATVYRESSGNFLYAPFRNAGRNGNTTLINYPQKASYLVASAAPAVDRMASSQSIVLGIAATTSITEDLSTPPSGMVNREQIIGSTSGQIVLHDTDGDVTAWTSTNYTASNAIEYVSMVIDIPSLAIPASGGGGGVRQVNIRGGADQ